MVSSNLENLVARRAAGASHPVILSKQGAHHIRRTDNDEEQHILSVGLACSECFSGQNLYRILRSGLEYEMKVMESLMRGETAAPLSIHTSSGVPPAMSGFLKALEPHLPWSENLDWCVSLQLEGASAVWAAIDMLLQLVILETGDTSKIKVAVGSVSYHGPPSTSVGAKAPLWAKVNQLKYPVPIVGEPFEEAELLQHFQEFLTQNKDDLGVILFEPQWGSSQAAFCWPPALLAGYVQMAKEAGVKVICDEIMCGLGRHGKGTLFLSEAWKLDPDAVTFGKAIGGGVFPLSGAILRQGRKTLGANKCTVMQSHTFAGSSVRALMAAEQVLSRMVEWLPRIQTTGDEMQRIFRRVENESNGLLLTNGQGLMWGGMFSRSGQCKNEKYRAQAVEVFKRSCGELAILPYYIPVGGFMVTPLYDIDMVTVREIERRLMEAVKRTVLEIEWRPRSPTSAIASEKTFQTNPFVVPENDKSVLQRRVPRTPCSN